MANATLILGLLMTAAFYYCFSRTGPYSNDEVEPPSLLEAQAPTWVYNLLKLNPMNGFIETYRRLLYDAGALLTTLRSAETSVAQTAADVARMRAEVDEYVDSRLADWKIRWHDTVADNGSSSRFVLADRAYSPHGIDRRLRVIFLPEIRLRSLAVRSAVGSQPLVPRL